MKVKVRIVIEEREKLIISKIFVEILDSFT